jgi:hypothetical protein
MELIIAFSLGIGTVAGCRQYIAWIHVAGFRLFILHRI